MKKRISGLLLTVSLLFSFMSCELFVEQKDKITKISFEYERITLLKGEVKAINFTVLPDTRVTDCEVKYSLSDGRSLDPDIDAEEKDISQVRITSTTSTGFILTAEKRGSVVVIAECEGLTAYMEVDVITDDLSGGPYIELPQVAYELKENEKTTFQVSLIGGETQDKALFEWSVSDSEVIQIDTAENACVVTALKSGFSEINITNPKASYGAKVLVYVNKEAESSVYITTGQNAVLIGSESGTNNITVSLVNSKVNDNSLFSFELEEGGNDIVSIISNNNVVSVTPKKPGRTTIKVTHPESKNSIEILVIVADEGCPAYIETDGTFFSMKAGESINTLCHVVSEELINNPIFKCEAEDENIIDVTCSNDVIYIKAKKIGQSKIFISNDNCQNVHEIYVVVEEDDSEIYYITTTQNIIKTEVGGSDIILDMYLSGGTESDKNNFTWSVDDSSIINVTTNYGEVKYDRSVVVNDDVITVDAIIKPVGAGTATITISNPKAYCDTKVKVIVYPQGTYFNQPCVLKGSGLVKVLKGSSQEHELQVLQGNVNVNLLNWKVTETKIANVTGNGLKGVINGIGSGITSCEVNSDELYNKYCATVISGTQEEIDSYNAMYTANNYIELLVNESGYYEIKCNNYVTDDYTCSINDETVCSARFSENVLIVKGIKKGKTEIVVNNVQCANSIVFYVNVIEEVSLSYPYYFTYDKFIGVVNGQYKDMQIAMVGADESVMNAITWRIEDPAVASIDGNGNKVRITALKTGNTVIYAHHDKCENDARIIVYTAETEAELQNRVVLDVGKTNYLSYIGKDIYVEVDINDREKNREKIQWNVDNISVIKIDSNYDNAYLRCIGAGNAVVTVSCDGALSEKIFISVKENESELELKDIVLPAVLEMDEEENKTINAAISGLSDDEIKNIEWSIEDNSIGSITGNGASGYVKALKEGITYIKVKNEKCGIEKKITFIVYKKGSVHLPVISMDRSYYNIKNGEVINVNVCFGSVVPSDTVISKLKWESNSNIVELNANGKNCSIKGKEEGIAKIKVSGEGIYNEYEFTVAVGNKDEIVNYFTFSASKMVGIVNGQSVNYYALMKDSFGNVCENGYSFIEYDMEGNDGIVEITQVDELFKIKALKTGTCYLNLRHPNVRESFKVLIYTADTESILNGYYPISTTKDHYLLQIGETARLNVETKDDEKLNGLIWSVDNPQICSYEIDPGRKSCKITGKKSGTAVFTVKHEDSPVDVKFTVSVTEYNNKDNDINIITESIIGLKTDDVYTTKITTNLSEAECEKLLWKTDTSGVISINSNGSECSITALKEGICELTVSYSSTCYRTIVVYVCQDNESVKSYKAMNIDRRYTRIRNNSSVSMYPVYGKNYADKENTVFEDVLQNNVVSIEKKDGAMCITGRNEGIAKIKVSNKDTNSFYIYVEVSEKVGSTISDTDTGYITVNQNIYALNVNKPDEYAEINIIPVGIEETKYNSFIWSVEDKTVCTINGLKDTCRVYPNKVGSTTVTVSSIYSSNVLSIKILVGENDNILIPYIYVDKNVLQVKGGENAEIECTLKNVSKPDISKFSCKVEDEKVCKAETLGNKISIKGISSGQTVVKISYPDMDDVNCVVSVKGIIDNLVYLTTSNNYNVVGKGQSISVGVDLKGYEETDQNHFKWTFKNAEDMDKVRISGNGPTVMLTGLKEGLCTIVCTHENPAKQYEALCPIEMSVRVTDEASYKPVYMKPEKNVIVLTEGYRETLNVSLVNSDESQYGYFTWTIPSGSENIISCVASGNQAIIQGKNPGIGRVTISHPGCVGTSSMDIVVIVEEDTSEDELYIKTDSTIIEAKLSDSYKTVNVNLVGGTSEQQLLFTWEILDYESIVKNQDGTSNPVISLVGQSGSQNIVRYLSEGNATVRVKNSATRSYLDIKFIINEHSTLAFEKTNLKIKQYESDTVKVTSPSGKTVYYNSSDDTILTCYGTGKICCIEALKPGTAVVTARTSDGSLKDELIVVVEKNTKAVPCYIVATSNVMSLNTQSEQGQSVKATLTGTYNGEAVTADDQEGLQWSIKSGKADIIKFSGSDGLNCRGNEITVLPVKSGTETIVVTHTKADYPKEIYVTVEQNAATLTISETYMVMQKEDIGSVTAKLTGVPASEEANIVWNCSDITKVMLIGSDKVSNAVKGSQVQFKAIELANDGVVITATYQNCIKTMTVFVQELPSLYMAVSSDIIRSGQTSYYNIICTPQSYLDKLALNYSTTMYTVRNKSDGTVMTGLFKSENDVKDGKDNPPAGIRVPYIKVTGGEKEGDTQFSLSSGNLTAVLNVKTDNSKAIEILRYREYDKNGKAQDAVMNPTIINGKADDMYVRVYYQLIPETVKVDEFTGVKQKILMKNGFLSNEQIDIKSGKDSEGLYFDLYPGKANYGDITLNTSGSKVADIKVSFVMSNAAEGFTLEAVNKPWKTTYDFTNGIIRYSADSTYKNTAPGIKLICNNSKQTYVSDMTSKMEIKDVFSYSGQGIMDVSTGKNKITKITKQSSPYSICVYYPTGYHMEGKYVKNFVVYYEKWE